MEFSKHILRALSIGLMFSAFSSVYAVERSQPRWKLYKKCIMRKCTDADKAQVRAELKKAGKWAGALLIAAAVAIGAGVLLKQFGEGKRADALLQAALVWAGSPSVTPAQKKYLMVFADWATKKGDKSEAKLKAEIRKKRANPQGDPCIEAAAAYMYYHVMASNISLNQGLIRAFRSQNFSQADGGPEVRGDCAASADRWVVPKEEVKPEEERKAKEDEGLLQRKNEQAMSLLEEVEHFFKTQYPQEQENIDNLLPEKFRGDQIYKHDIFLLHSKLDAVKRARVFEKAFLEEALREKQPGQADTKLNQAMEQGKNVEVEWKAYVGARDALKEDIKRLQEREKQTEKQRKVAEVERKRMRAEEEHKMREKERLEQEKKGIIPELSGEKNLALVIAAAGGNVATMKKLLVDGVSPDSQNKAGDSALHRAVIAGKADAVGILLKAGADKGAKDRRGQTALEIAEQRKRGRPKEMGPIIKLLKE